MRYRVLFNLEIAHGYYTDQRCPDFRVEPTSVTQKLLSQQQCLLKQLPNGLQILTAINHENIPFISLPENQVFAFHLRLRNSNFSLFTDLAKVRQLTALLYTNELPAVGGDLVPVSQEAWFTEQFIVQHPNPREPFALSRQPLKGPKTTGAFLVNGLGEKTRKRYDEDARRILVNSSNARPGTSFAVTYPVTPRLESDVFAEIAIQYNSTGINLSGNAGSFRITFNSRKARWKYYVITNTSDSKPILPSLEDKDKAIFFPVAGQTNLTQSPDPSDEVAVRLVRQHPDKQLFRFISGDLVPCRQAARKNIELHLNGNKVIDSLPNPPLQNYCMDRGNAAQECSLYQVVHYFTP